MAIISEKRYIMVEGIVNAMAGMDPALEIEARSQVECMSVCLQTGCYKIAWDGHERICRLYRQSGSVKSKNHDDVFYCQGWYLGYGMLFN